MREANLKRASEMSRNSSGCRSADPPRRRGIGRAFALFCLLLGLSAVVRPALGQQDQAPQPAQPAAPDDPLPGVRDSLLLEVDKYTRMIQKLREALEEEELRTEDRRILGREAIDMALEEFGGAIRSLSQELKDLDLDIDDQTISLRDRDGGDIKINIPDDLGERISRGITSITATILDELPDSLTLSGDDAVWRRHFRVESRAEPRRMIGGDAIKIWDNVVVNANEEVDGNVVGIFGDASISGRVDGDVIVVMGDLEVTETAEITGSIVTVLGRLDRAEEAEVQGSVVVLDPYMTHEIGSVRNLFAGGWLAFLAKQVIFLIVAFLVLLALVVFPETRLEAAQQVLRERSGSALGYGILAAIVGHIALLLLLGVLILTVIGIPLALLLALGWLGLGLLAIAVVALGIGRRVCQILHLSCRHNWIQALMGLVLLHLVTFLGALLGLWSLLSPLAFLFGIVGLGIKLLVFCIGLGALLISRFGAHGSQVEKAPVAVSVGPA